jgi:rubrerythrin
MAPIPIRTVEEFYAHAIAIEREAAARYAEFVEWFDERGEEVLAGLCRTLARQESEHLTWLEEACRGVPLPRIDAGAYRWIEAGSPEAPAREVFYRVAEPRHLLEIALQAERNAVAFFDWVACSSPHPGVAALARQMRAEEARHVHWAAQALEYHPSRRVDWERELR